MFELEVHNASMPVEELPQDIKALFHDSDASIAAIALIPWAEHCTECAMPACYKSCDLYAARKDGKCRRFLNGILPIHGAPNPQNYIAMVQFKRWATLMAYAHAHPVPIQRAQFAERLSRTAETLTAKIPDGRIAVLGRSGLSSRLLARAKHSVTRSGALARRQERWPDYFLVEAYNPSDQAVKLSLTMSNPCGPPAKPPFQELLEITKGFSRYKIRVDRIRQHVNIEEPLQISLNPNILKAEDEGLTLYFGMLTFVWDDNAKPSPDGAYSLTTIGDLEVAHTKPVKLVLWDLDNTIWEGTLLEDGPGGVRLQPGIVAVIKELDRRGILQSAVSKNDSEIAIEQLDRLQISQYFLSSRIGWGAKGGYVQELIHEFNIGADTVVFIDDSPFEREQVAATNPLVRVLPSSIYTSLLDRPEFNPPATTEASHRRELYRTEKRRDAARAVFDGDYFAFLRSCNIILTITPVCPDNLERVHELIQRTNQLNFSGNRYTREQVAAIVADPRFDHFCVECTDRFGEYGIVGFAMVETIIPRLTDLAFSCRVQSKRVEHAFLSFLLQEYRRRGATTFEALYQATERNRPAAQVFDDLGFIQRAESGNTVLYRFDLSRPIPSDGLIEIRAEGYDDLLATAAPGSKDARL